MSGIAIVSLIVLGVLIATGVTDTAYVFFNAAVLERHRMRATNWSTCCLP